MHGVQEGVAAAGSGVTWPAAGAGCGFRTCTVSRFVRIPSWWTTSHRSPEGRKVLQPGVQGRAVVGKPQARRDLVA